MIFPHRYYVAIKQAQTWRRAFALFRDLKWRQRYVEVTEIMTGKTATQRQLVITLREQAPRWEWSLTVFHHHHDGELHHTCLACGGARTQADAFASAARCYDIYSKETRYDYI